MSVKLSKWRIRGDRVDRFTLDTLHTLTFFSIFATLVISAVTLKLVDYEKGALAKKVNRIGSFAVVTLYIVLNIVFRSGCCPTKPIEFKLL